MSAKIEGNLRDIKHLVYMWELDEREGMIKDPIISISVEYKERHTVYDIHRELLND